MTSELSIREGGFQLDAGLVPWDSDVFGFQVAQISDILVEDIHQANASFEMLRQWIGVNNVKMISCRLPHDRLESSFFLEQQGFKFIEMVLHPVIENLQDIQIPGHGLQVSEALENEVELIRVLAEKCFAHERFHVDPRLSTEMANLRYGRWVRNSTLSSTQRLLKVDDGNEIVAFFIVEEQKDKGAYWHLTAVTPEFQGRGYGRKSWQTMLACHQFSGVKRVATTISARNERVLNLYSHLQFRFAPPEMTFHWVAE